MLLFDYFNFIISENYNYVGKIITWSENIINLPIPKQNKKKIHRSDSFSINNEQSKVTSYKQHHNKNIRYDRLIHEGH